MIAGFENLNHYQVLDLSCPADREEIQEGYRRMKETFGHDALASYSLYSQEERETILELMERAFHTLMDDEEREEYDKLLSVRLSFRGTDQADLPLWDNEEERAGIGREAEDVPEGDRAPWVVKSVSHVTEIGQMSPAEPASEPGRGDEGDKEDSSFAASGQPEAEKGKGAAGDAPADEGAGLGGQPEEISGQGVDEVEAAPASHEGEEPEGERTLGAVLARARESMGYTVDRVWEITKIRRPIIRAMEEEDVEVLPEAVFLKGMVLTYARLLEVDDPGGFAEAYLEKIGELGKD